MATLYRVTGTVVHHTTDNVGLSKDVTYPIPQFLLEAEALFIANEEQALEVARQIVCPMTDELQYEAVTVKLEVEVLEMW